MKVNFLSQIRLSHRGDGPKVAKRLVEVYFALFKVMKVPSFVVLASVPLLGLLNIFILSQCKAIECGYLYEFLCCIIQDCEFLMVLNLFLSQVLISEAGGSLMKDKKRKEDDKKASNMSKDSKVDSQSSELHVEMDSRLLTALLTVSTVDFLLLPAKNTQL